MKRYSELSEPLQQGNRMSYGTLDSMGVGPQCPTQDETQSGSGLHQILTSSKPPTALSH